MVLRTIHRVAAEDLNVKGSALLRQRAWAATSVASLNSERRRKSVTLAVNRRRVVLLGKRAARENEGKGPLVNLADNRREVERKLQASSTAHGNQSASPISRSVEAKSRKGERHRRVHNNFAGAIFLQRLRRTNFGAACFLRIGTSHLLAPTALCHASLRHRRRNL